MSLFSQFVGRMFFSSNAVIASDDVATNVSEKGLASLVHGLKVSNVPVGTVVPYAGVWDPSKQQFKDRERLTGWMLCDGRELSSDEYEELYEAVNKTYGQGTESKLFRIPAIESRVIVGASSPTSTAQMTHHPLGGNGGQESVSLTSDNIPAHSHEFLLRLHSDADQKRYVTPNVECLNTDLYQANGKHFDENGKFGAYRYSGQTDANSTQNKPVLTMPPFIAMNFLIKVR